MYLFNDRVIKHNTKANAAKLRFADCYEAVTLRVMAILKTKKLNNNGVQERESK